MDSTAASMCRDNNMPILVFGLSDPENIVRAVKGEKIGTLVNNEGKTLGLIDIFKEEFLKWVSILKLKKRWKKNKRLCG